MVLTNIKVSNVAFLLSLLFFGCDRWIIGSINNAEVLNKETICGDLTMRVTRFNDVGVEFRNISTDTILVDPNEFFVSARDFTKKGFDLFFEDRFFHKKDGKLRVPPKGEFGFSFNSGDTIFAVSGDKIFEHNGDLCNLDTVRISLPLHF